MPAFQYQSVLLHGFADNKGWLIIGIKYDNRRDIITTFSASTGEWLAQRWADMASRDLAGKPNAEID